MPKGSLRLEITESLVMENPEQATEILEWLRGAGAELALDDFGTGYSSLAYLQRFPFDTIKIDRSLVQSSGRATEPAAPSCARSSRWRTSSARRSSPKASKPPRTSAFLRSIGCQYAQGFYYGEPMSERDVLQLLKMVRTAEHKLRPRGFFRAKAKTAQNEQKGRKKGRGATPPPVHANGNAAATVASRRLRQVRPAACARCQHSAEQHRAPAGHRAAMSPAAAARRSATPAEFGGSAATGTAAAPASIADYRGPAAASRSSGSAAGAVFCSSCCRPSPKG